MTRGQEQRFDLCQGLRPTGKGDSGWFRDRLLHQKETLKRSSALKVSQGEWEGDRWDLQLYGPHGPLVCDPRPVRRTPSLGEADSAAGPVAAARLREAVLPNFLSEPLPLPSMLSGEGRGTVWSVPHAGCPVLGSFPSP